VRRSAGVPVCAAALAVAAGGCGTPSADLFVVTRSGSVPGARLTLRVDDGGEVRCDGGPKRPMTSSDLIAARDVARKLKDLPRKRLRVAAGRRTVLRYRVLFEDGEIAFADSSRTAGDLRTVTQRLAALTRRLAQGPCGRVR
jgi:hypothetical protein